MAFAEEFNGMVTQPPAFFEARLLADHPMTLEELCLEFGVARVRVRQLETRLIEKLKAISDSLTAQELPPVTR